MDETLLVTTMFAYTKESVEESLVLTNNHPLTPASTQQNDLPMAIEVQGYNLKHVVNAVVARSTVVPTLPLLLLLGKAAHVGSHGAMHASCDQTFEKTTYLADLLRIGSQGANSAH